MAPLFRGPLHKSSIGIVPDPLPPKVVWLSETNHEMQLTWSGGPSVHVINCNVQLAILCYIQPLEHNIVTMVV